MMTCYALVVLRFGLLLLSCITRLESVAVPVSARQCKEAYFVYANKTHETSLPCSPVCPPTVSVDRSVEFCRQNCPDYYRCLLDKIPTTAFSTRSASLVISQTGAPGVDGCQPTYFYHPKYGIVVCTRVCQTLNDFCANNCPKYHSCLVQRRWRRKQGARNVTGGAGRISHARPTWTGTTPSLLSTISDGSTTSNDVAQTLKCSSCDDSTWSLAVTAVLIIFSVVATCSFLLILTVVLARRYCKAPLSKAPVTPDRDRRTRTTCYQSSAAANHDQNGEQESLSEIPSLCAKHDPDETGESDDATLHYQPADTAAGLPCTEPSSTDHQQLSLHSDPPSS